MKNTFDRAEIITRGGDGGSGAVSFRHEKYVPLGGPDGGEGGRGGNVIIRATKDVSNLNRYRFRKVYQAECGRPGGGGNRKGRQGRDIVLEVPPGTRVVNKASGALLADLVVAGQEITVAKGGAGGLGNASFVSSTNQVPRLAQKGGVGEELSIILELRMIADVGIIGYPNVGKSSLLSLVTNSHTKIANYPFTTLEPALGVVEREYPFVLAEIPGLVAGAHEGKGLGDEFLRHAMRCRVFIHLIDGTSESPLADFLAVSRELELFDAELALKPRLVSINKIDLPDVRAKTAELKMMFEGQGVRPVFISAGTGEGVMELLNVVEEMLTEVPVMQIEEEVILRPGEVTGVHVYKEGEHFRVIAPDIERVLARVDIGEPEVYRQVCGLLERRGVNRALSRAGAKPGDAVIIGGTRWPW